MKRGNEWEFNAVGQKENVAHAEVGACNGVQNAPGPS